MSALATWTDVGAEEGRDPLAMLNAVERVYPGLLPGMSSLTTRLRQYAFHSWWITDYVDTEPIRLGRSSPSGPGRSSIFRALEPPGDGRVGAGGGLIARAELASGRDPIELRRYRPRHPAGRALHRSGGRRVRRRLVEPDERDGLAGSGGEARPEGADRPRPRARRGVRRLGRACGAGLPRHLQARPGHPRRARRARAVPLLGASAWR